MSAGTRVDHDRFCLHEGWELVGNARGRPVGHHVTYELTLRDGAILRTRISHPVSNKTYGVRLWKAILRDQLVVTEEQFWACVRDKQLPNRGGNDDIPENALPAALVYQLIHEVGRTEAEIAAMTVAEAMVVMTDYWSRPRPR